MTTSDNRNKRFRDFEHTVRVVTARAIAGDERAAIAHRRLIARPAASMTVTAMAAAGAGVTDLPKGEILAKDGQLGARFEAIEGKLRVTLQLKGFSAISTHANRTGHFVTRNGLIDHPLQFDARGKAVCILLDAPEVRAGLQDFELTIDAPGA